MANNQKEDLFFLIKKLSKTETRQFKKTSTIQDGQGTEYIKLFEEIELQSEYDEESILKKLNKTQPQLSRIKNYLFEKVVNYLNEIYQDEDNLIQNLLKSYDTFINIDLPELGYKYLLEAKKYAQLYSRNGYLHIIHNKEVDYFKSNNKLTDKIIKDYIMQEGIAVDLFKDNYEITAQIIKGYIDKKHFIYVSPDEKLKVKETPPANMENDSLLEINYYESLKSAYYNKGDLFNAIIVSANIIEHVLNKKLNPNLFFRNLSILFDELLVTKRVKEFKFFEKKVIAFFNSFTETQKIHFKAEYTFCLFKCRYYIGKAARDHQAVNKTVIDYSEVFLSEQKISNQLLFFYLCSAHMHFCNGNDKEALKALAIFRNTDINIDPQLWYESSVLEIAIRISKTDSDTLIESQLRSLSKFINKIDGDTEYEKLTISCLNKLNGGQEEKLMKGLGELKESFMSAANQRKRLFYSFNILYFLESRLSRKSYKDLYFN